MTENGGLAGLAGRWAGEAIATSHISLSYNEVRSLMVDLAGRLVDLLTAQPFTAEPAMAIGERLVAEHFTGKHALDHTLRILGHELLAAAGLAGQDGMAARLTELTGALAAGYVDALRERLFDEQEMIKRAVFRAREVSEQQRVATEARFRAVFDSSSVGIAIIDLSGNLALVNPALIEILGTPAEDLLGASLGTLPARDEVPKVLSAFGRVIAGTQNRFIDDVNFLGGDGEPRWTRFSLTLVRDGRGAPDYAVGIVEDISDLRLLQINQRTHSLHDQLTGLPNRAQFMSTLNARLRRAGPGEKITLAFVDLDGFKIITDGVGHDTGDEVLRRVASVLTKVFPEPESYVARMGGDGFGILATDRTGSFEFSQRITAALEEFGEPVYYDGETGVAVSASVGIVERDPAGATSEELVRAAELTTHRAKAGGKAQWVLYDEEDNRRDQASFQLGAAIPGALETGQFVVSYQPIRRLADGRLAGLRSLLHWEHPQRGVLRPDEFIGMAEETGFIVPLGQWWLEMVCRQIGEWQQRFDRVPVIGIAIGERLANEQDLIRILRDVLAGTGADPSKLRIGIPATAAVDAAGEPVENLTTLADLDLASVVSNYGARGVGLLDVRRLPVCAVSVAPELVRAFAENEPGSPFEHALAHLVALTGPHRIDVVANGVDDPGLPGRLSAIGVRLGVGDALGAAVDGAAMTEQLAAEFGD